MTEKKMGKENWAINKIKYTNKMSMCIGAQQYQVRDAQ